jgi:phosphatidylglycerol:prolipoprotein diacylglycerol transferase
VSPSLGDGVIWTYALPVMVGVFLTVLYPTAPQVQQDAATKRGYRTLLVVTFGFGILGAKLVALLGDHGGAAFDGFDLTAYVSSGRSIIGGLLFGHLASEIARRVIGYTALPNDRLVVGLCLGVVVGRIGCTLSGCCLGIPSVVPFALLDAQGIGRVPIAPLEAVLHVVLAVFFFGLEKRGVLLGRLFSLYLVLYGVFRFASEPWRQTPKDWAGLSLYQWTSVACVLIGMLGVYWRGASSVWRARVARGLAERGLAPAPTVAEPAQAKERP